MSLDNKILVLGSEGTGKHGISKCLVENKIAAALDLDVLTCTSLPLPGDRDLFHTGVQFICFVMQTSSKESFGVLTDCLSKVDISYFCGRSVIIANETGRATEKGVTSDEIRNIADRYGIPVFYTNTQVEPDLQDLGQKLIGLIQAVMGWKRHVSPLLYETMCVAETKTVTLPKTPATPGV